MPIYKAGNAKKDGLQKYFVRINYIADSGKKKQLTRVAYGLDIAKDLERRLEHKIKTQNEMPVRKMTVKQLYDEYISVKKYEVRESTLNREIKLFNTHILPILKDVHIDKLSAQILQDWKISIEEKGLAFKTKQKNYSELRAMLNYAVRMEYIQRNPLFKIRNFKDVSTVKKEMNFYMPEEFKK